MFLAPSSQPFRRFFVVRVFLRLGGFNSELGGRCKLVIHIKLDAIFAHRPALVGLLKLKSRRQCLRPGRQRFLENLRVCWRHIADVFRDKTPRTLSPSLIPCGLKHGEQFRSIRRECCLRLICRSARYVKLTSTSAARAKHAEMKVAINRPSMRFIVFVSPSKLLILASAVLMSLNFYIPGSSF